MSESSHPQGTFCWPELSTKDPAGAKKFYSSSFGWTIVDQDMGPQGVYTIFNLNDQPVAAAHQMDPHQQSQGIPSHWLSYIAVNSADETLAKVTSLGGKVLMGPFDVFDLGRMGVAQDPHGAAFAVWQAKTMKGVGVKDQASSLVWTELMTTDADKARDFYTKLLGYKSEIMEMGPMKYTVLKVGDTPVGGMLKITPDMGPVPPNWMPYFGVDDCDGFVKKAVGNAATSCMPPTDIPNVGRFAVLQDPTGAMFSVIKFLPRS